MAVEVFNFCPDGTVPVTLPPEVQQGMSMNGWTFTSRPQVPYAKRFKVTLYGLKWIILPTGLYDNTTQATINARMLELFYQRHEMWKPFTWKHPHLGDLTVRFNEALSVPEGMVNSGGRIEKLEMRLIEHNPGYTNGLS